MLPTPEHNQLIRLIEPFSQTTDAILLQYNEDTRQAADDILLQCIIETANLQMLEDRQRGM